MASRSRGRRQTLWIGVLGTSLTLGVLVGVFLYKLFLSEELYDAALKGDLARAQGLLDRGADPNFMWEDGTTVLQAAKESPRLQELLRKAGAR